MAAESAARVPPYKPWNLSARLQPPAVLAERKHLFAQVGLEGATWSGMMFWRMPPWIAPKRPPPMPG
jgi:hypothetical protein